MKHDLMVTANSLAVVAAGFYILCVLLVYIAPDLYLSIAQSWMHGADVSQIWRSNPPEFGSMLTGFISFTLSAWVAGYAFAWVYNYFLKNK